MEVESSPDEALVEQAVAFIRDAIERTVERGFQDVGDYVFGKFYRRDPKLVRSKSPHKPASYRALLERCDSVDLPLGRTSIYNAVAVAAMQHELGAGTIAYKQLPHSHQVALLPVRDPRKVEKLATRALSKRLAVRALREEVAGERAASAPDGEKRGRKPFPVLFKAFKGATALFTVDGRVRQVTKAQVDQLSDAQRTEVLKMAEQLMAVCQAALGKLD